MTTYRIGNHVYFLGMVEARSVNVTNTTITTTTTTVRRRSAGKEWMCLYFSIHKAVSRDAPGLFPPWSSGLHLEDGRGPQWRPESAEIFIFRNTLWPSGRFIRGFFFKNYLGWRGQKISLKISSGAQSENLEPSFTIQEFFSKKYSWFYMQRMCTFIG